MKKEPPFPTNKQMIESNLKLADLAIKRKIWPRREQDIWVVFEDRSYACALTHTSQTL